MTTSKPTTVSSEILDLAPPFDAEAEMALLGSLILDSRLCDDVAIEVTAGEFYLEPSRILFTHIMDIHNSASGVDLVLLSRRLKDSSDWEAVGGLAYLGAVKDSVAVAAHAVHYAKIVREKAVLRALNEVATEILRDVADTTMEPKELLARTEQRIFAVADRRGGRRVRKIDDVLFDAMDAIDARVEGGAPGLPTGFADLDTLLGGLQDSELIILAGRPGMGKTAMALNILEHASCECGVPVLLLSLEMGELEIVQRMLCSRAEVDGYKFRTGCLNDKEREQLVQASAKQGRSPFWIDDSAASGMMEIAAVARRLKRKENLGLIVIDYLQLITPDDKRMPRQEQVASMSRRLKALARELQVPVLCVAQLNREVEKGGENRPRLSHLRESGAIEQDADVVMFIHREEYYRDGDEVNEVRGEADLLVRKQRNGPTGDVKLTWQAQFTRFTNRAQQEPF